MEIIQENDNGITQIIIKGRLDAETVPEAARLIKDMVGQEKIRLLVDICGLEYISSAGLRLILHCSNEIVWKVLTSSRLPIVDSVAAGIRELS
jgi:anti-anti-sigma factor